MPSVTENKIEINHSKSSQITDSESNNEMKSEHSMSEHTTRPSDNHAHKNTNLYRKIIHRESDVTKDFLVLTRDKIISLNSETWEKKVYYLSTNDFWRLNAIISKTDDIRSEMSEGSVKKLYAILEHR